MLILIRHGKSVWNKKNLFTGWVDVPLCQEGIEESIAIGKKIAHLPISRVFTSNLIRSHMTLVFALMQHQSGKIPVFQHSGNEGKIYSEKEQKNIFPVYANQALNERMYGELQGMNKAEMAQKFGQSEVQHWRRSYDGVPPGGESLAQTCERAIPYFQKEIIPFVEKGECVLVVAHGNSLRGIAMQLQNLSKEEVVHFEIATGSALFYEKKGNLWEKHV